MIKNLKYFLLFFIFGVANAQVVWNSNNFYQKGAIVLNDGVAYVALSRNLNKNPKISPQFWIARSIYSSNVQSINTQQENPVAIGFSSDLNFGINQNVSSTSSQIENWSSAKAYTKGKIVAFDSAVWRASYWTQGEAPGSSDAWTPTVTTKWTPYVAYVKGQSAIYNGNTYTAQWWTKGDIPLSDKTGVWLVGLQSSTDLANGQKNYLQPNQPGNQPISSAQTQTQSQVLQYAIGDQKLDPNAYTKWRADTSYALNALVNFADAVWRKNGNLDTRANPSEDGQWIPITTTQWYPKVSYQKGMAVTANNAIWYSQWYNINIFPPKDSTGVWVEVDSNGNRIYTSENSDYSLRHIYVKGDKTMYNGHSWLSMYWNQGETPGSSMAWVPLTVTKWYANVSYDPRDINTYRFHVLYNGIEWEALWWCKGDIPSKSAVWKPLSLTEWISAYAYSAKDEVLYDGTKWRAKWWTQNEVPSNSDVWEALSIANWSSQRSYTAGDQVKFTGSTWIAQWWTKGETPGISNVWKK
jgi:chitodextrinase